MADTFNTTSNFPSEGADLSPVSGAFSQFLSSTVHLLDAERDLADFAGLGWDPAVDVWFCDAERAQEATLAALRDLFAQPVHREGDRSLRVIGRIWDQVMRSADPCEVSDLRAFVLQKQHLFRLNGSNPGSRAVNHMIMQSFARLLVYIRLAEGPDLDLSPSVCAFPTPRDLPGSGTLMSEADLAPAV